MKKTYQLLAVLAFFNFSCKKDNAPSKATSTEVYIAGQDMSAGVALWHDGQQLFWHGTYGWIGNAYGVAIKDTNVYVAGIRDHTRAVYWKNGEENWLSDNSETAVAKSILLSGNDIYVSGYKLSNTDNAYQAGYWKNGVFNILAAKPYKLAECTDIAVVNNTIYAVGYMDISPVGSTEMAGIYWKDGDTTILSKGYFSQLNAIKVAGDNVYICGKNITNGAYWINSELHDLGDQAEALDIDVSGSDVYVVGYEFGTGTPTAAYWKNGQKTLLGSGMATGIQVVDGDIYIGGVVDIDNVSTAVYWKNGVRYMAGVASTSGFDVKTSGIAVMKR